MRSRLASCLALLALCASALGDDLKVGVYYSPYGQKGILAGLADVDGIQAGELPSLGAASLSKCDVVVWPHSALKPKDHARPWRLLLTEYVKRGGGLILTHVGAGGFRGVAKDEPLFPKIAVATGRRELAALQKAHGVSHPIVGSLPAAIRHAYYDHITMEPGTDGRTLYVDDEGNAVVVAGRVGRGRVVVMGNLPGYKGVKKDGKLGLEGPTTVEGGELALLVEAVKWAGGSQRTPPAELEAALEAAVDGAVVRAAAAREEPVMVFSAGITGNHLDTKVWDYAPRGPGTNKWGTWYGHGIVGPPYNMFLETFSANRPITSRSFERSPVRGRFLFTGEAILSRMFAGILEWRLVDETDSGDLREGYGIRLVYGGVEEKRPGYAFRRDNKEHHVRIGDARHAILKIAGGKATELAVVRSPGRLRSPKDSLERRVPVRFERTGDGELILSVDGKEVARARDPSYNTFTKLRAIMTTPGGRLGFDNPKVTAYFTDAGAEEYAPTPWIIPEPKEMTKNGQDFTLVDGAQFVVSDRKKIDTYLLDEWIIPEIEGRYGVRMKAVTISEVDGTKPAIHLGESADRAFAKAFDARLKAVGSGDPEGHAILVTRDKAQAAGATEQGTFWALQSLVQLVERDRDAVCLRGAYVRDWPDFRLRGSLSSLWSRKDRIQSNMERALSCVRLLARYKANVLVVGGHYFGFPSYDLSGYGCQWSFKQLAQIYELCQRYHIQAIPWGFGLAHAGMRVDFYLARRNPKLWQWIMDNKVLADDLSNRDDYHADSFNALSPHAWQMCKALNQDFIDINPRGKIFMSIFDEIRPPIHTYAPKGTEVDLLVEWITRVHGHLKAHGRRMMMYTDYLAEAAKFPGSNASLGRTDCEGMPVHDAVDRIPKDIILADWYYGTTPERPIYAHLKGKGFDVVAVPGSVHGYPYESVYYSAVEGKKAGLLGIIAFGFDFGAYINPQYGSYALPWIYGWTVPDKMEPDWNWQEHWQHVFQGPLPSHTGQVVPLDISSACNESRTDDKAEDGRGWVDYGKISDLRRLPPGEIAHRHCRFNIIDEAANNSKSVVVVSARKGEKASDHRKITGIPVGCKAESLIFLHAGTSLGPLYVSDFCTYRIHYDDGTSAALPIKYGHQIGPWIYSADTGSSRLDLYYRSGHLSWCRLVSTGRTAMGEKTGLYAYEWVNPHPERGIASIDMQVGIDRDVRVALVALSVAR